MPSNLEYFNRRLHSLLGVIPIGIFLIQHFVINHFATRGPEAFNQAAHFMESLPFRYALEIFIIFLPIMFHAVYGIFIAFKGKSNTSRYGFFRNWMFLLQRVSGVFLVIFIAWHVWDTRVQAMFGQEVNYEMMANILQNNWMFAFYIVGIVAATFHFANGLWSFAVSWGITVTPKSQKIMTYVSIVVFIALTYVGVASALAFV